MQRINVREQKENVLYQAMGASIALFWWQQLQIGHRKIFTTTSRVVAWVGDFRLAIVL